MAGTPSHATYLVVLTVKDLVFCHAFPVCLLFVDGTGIFLKWIPPLPDLTKTIFLG
jgi:hypothetical protein